MRKMALEWVFLSTYLVRFFEVDGNLHQVPHVQREIIQVFKRKISFLRKKWDPVFSIETGTPHPVPQGPGHALSTNSSGF